REQDRLVLGPPALQCLLPPRVPVDGILGVLEQVRAGLGGEAVHHRTVSARPLRRRNPEYSTGRNEERFSARRSRGLRLAATLVVAAPGSGTAAATGVHCVRPSTSTRRSRAASRRCCRVRCTARSSTPRTRGRRTCTGTD